MNNLDLRVGLYIVKNCKEARNVSNTEMQYKFKI